VGNLNTCRPVGLESLESGTDAQLMNANANGAPSRPDSLAATPAEAVNLLVVGEFRQ
jgi:hypothetical protein